VIRAPRLLCNANSQEPKQNPAKGGGDACQENTPNSYKNNSGQDEGTCENEKREQKDMGGSISHNRGMQAEHDAAGKRCGDRYSRQPHGNLRNLTKVSM
jgi:hypothetical protein